MIGFVWFWACLKALNLGYQSYKNCSIWINDQQVFSLPRQSIKFFPLLTDYELNDEGLAAYQRGEWTVSLGGIPVRWFPGTYSLKERKHRERFVAIIKNLPEDMTTATLYQGALHQFLLTAKVDAFKIIKLADGSRKLLGYYKNLDDMKDIIGKQQLWTENSLEWCALD